MVYEEKQGPVAAHVNTAMNLPVPQKTTYWLFQRPLTFNEKLYKTVFNSQMWFVSLLGLAEMSKSCFHSGHLDCESMRHGSPWALKIKLFRTDSGVLTKFKTSLQILQKPAIKSHIRLGNNHTLNTHVNTILYTVTSFIFGKYVEILNKMKFLTTDREMFWTKQYLQANAFCLRTLEEPRRHTAVIRWFNALCE